VSTQPPVEICGNCIDDDGNGLVDWDDPACCAGGVSTPLDLRALRIRGRNDGPALKLVARLAGLDLTDLKPSTRTLYLQLTPDGAGPLVCATIEATRLHATRRRLRFTDRRGLVPEADGIDRVRIRLRRGGNVTLKAIGRGLGFATPGPGTYRVIVGVRDLAVADSEVSCLGATATLEATRDGTGVRLP
jgi:hypothetical protein